MAFSDDHKVHPLGPDNGADNPTTRRFVRSNFTHQLLANPGIATVKPGKCVPNAPPEPGNKITGGGRLGSPINFGFVAKEMPLNGTLNYRDDGAANGPLTVRSSNGIDSVNFSGNCGMFTGNAKVNNKPKYRFNVTACDNGSTGAGQDTFNINVTGPNFSYGQGGTITSGNIKLRRQ